MSSARQAERNPSSSSDPPSEEDWTMKALFKTALLFLIVYLFFGGATANALQAGGIRIIKLTLIPDYVNRSIRFDGQITLDDAAKPLDWQGLPLIVEHQWKAEKSPVWT